MVQHNSKCELGFINMSQLFTIEDLKTLDKKFKKIFKGKKSEDLQRIVDKINNHQGFQNIEIIGDTYLEEYDFLDEILEDYYSNQKINEDIEDKKLEFYMLIFKNAFNHDKENIENLTKFFLDILNEKVKYNEKGYHIGTVINELHEDKEKESTDKFYIVKPMPNMIKSVSFSMIPVGKNSFFINANISVDDNVLLSYINTKFNNSKIKTKINLFNDNQMVIRDHLKQKQEKYNLLLLSVIKKMFIKKVGYVFNIKKATYTFVYSLFDTHNKDEVLNVLNNSDNYHIISDELLKKNSLDKKEFVITDDNNLQINKYFIQRNYHTKIIENQQQSFIENNKVEENLESDNFFLQLRGHIDLARNLFQYQVPKYAEKWRDNYQYYNQDRYMMFNNRQQLNYFCEKEQLDIFNLKFSTLKMAINPYNIVHIPRKMIYLKDIKNAIENSSQNNYIDGESFDANKLISRIDSIINEYDILSKINSATLFGLVLTVLLKGDTIFSWIVAIFNYIKSLLL